VSRSSRRGTRPPLRRYRPSAVLAASLSLLASSATAQRVPTGYQEYFVTGFEQHVYDMMLTVATGEGGTTFDNTAGFSSAMNSVVAVTAAANGQRIYYDQWEDGLDSGLKPSLALLAPVQASTLVLGDGDNANGRACEFTTDPRVYPCNGTASHDDAIFAGSYLALQSNQGLIASAARNPQGPGACTPGIPVPPQAGPPISYYDLRNCSVPLPGGVRDPADVRYDGGDRIVSSGGPLSVAHEQDPLSVYIADAIENLSKQTVGNAVSYTVPVGVDIYAGNNTPTEPFKYVFLDLVAFEDNTTLSLNSPGAGTATVTLSAGQHYSSRGFVDSAAAPAITVNAGTKILASAPVFGMIYTGGPGTFATRHFSLLPDLLHSTDYVTTAAGDNPPPSGDRPLNLYILNPDPANTLTVTATDSVGSCTNTVDPNSVRNYFDFTSGAGCGGQRYVPSNSQVRLRSDRKFWGLSAYDHQGSPSDWGHSWLPKRFLADAYRVAFAPGVNNPASVSATGASRSAAYTARPADADCTIPPTGVGNCDSINRDPLFISATEDNTRVKVDLNGDGLYDFIDINGDDCPDSGDMPNDGSCGTPINGCPGVSYTSCVYRLDTTPTPARAQLRIFDHLDYDNSGTVVVANKPIGVSWGQDTDRAAGSDPVLDAGYAVYPINQAFLDPVLTIDKTAASTVIPIAGGPVTYTLAVKSYGFGPLSNLQVYDVLPAGFACSSYASGSSLITYPDLSQDAGNPTCAPDPVTPSRSRLTWTLSPNPYTLAANATLTVRYVVNFPAAPGGTPREVTNRGEAQATLGGSVFHPSDTEDLVQTDVTLTKSVDNATPAPGATLTFSLVVRNTGATNETNVIVSDAIPANVTFLGSIVSAGPFTGAYSPSQNAVVWTAAALTAGSGPYTLSFQVRVDPTVPSGTTITNRGGYESTQTPYFRSNTAVPVVAGPKLTVSKSGPGRGVSLTSLTRSGTTATATTATAHGFTTGNVVTVSGAVESAYDGAFTVTVPSPTSFSYTVAGSPATPASGSISATRSYAVSTLTRSGATATVTTAAPHGFASGDFVTISGADQSGYDGTLAVTVTGASTFSYTVVGTPTTPATGTIRATGAPVVHPGEVVTFEVRARNTGVTAATNLQILDPIPVNTSYVAGSLRRSLNAGAFAALTDAADADEGQLLGGSPRLLLASLGPGEDVVLRFQVTVNAGTGSPAGQVLVNQATVSASELSPRDTNVVALGIVGDATVTGRTFLDANLNGVYDAGEGIANVDVVVTDSLGTLQRVASDANGVYTVTVAPGTTSLNVDETDPDFPPSATLFTANDPQDVTAINGSTVASANVGYRQPGLSISKTSSAGGSVVPGQTLTYTIEVTNNSATTQNGVVVGDVVPVGTSYVPGSARVTGGNVFRVTEYSLDNSGTDGAASDSCTEAGVDYSGTVCTLKLDQNLASDYFVIVQGSDVNGGRDTQPAQDQVALTNDPFGGGDFAGGLAANRLQLTRNADATNWSGVVTVVECLTDCSTDGFRLLSKERVNLPAGGAPGSTSGTDTATTAWTDLSRVMLVGAANGAGCNTGDTTVLEHQACQLRLTPSGASTIGWTRDGGGQLPFGAAATATVMVVQWGSAWTVQRAAITNGNAGGNAINGTNEYNTVAITPVPRANTWVWGTGHTNDSGTGGSAEGVALTLGDGVNTNSTESLIAAGIDTTNNAIDFDVYALTHSGLAVDHRFLTQGTVARGTATADVTFDPAAAGTRMALSYNSYNENNNDFPKPLFSARYLNDTTIRIERRRTGQTFAAWIQGIDFSGIRSLRTCADSAATCYQPSGSSPSNILAPANNYGLARGASATVTFQVTVNSPLAGAIANVANTANLTAPSTGSASVSDPVVRPSVAVQYDNATFVEQSASDTTVLFRHNVTNTGNAADSYNLTGLSELGWRLELLDPATGQVFAADSNGDGVWDGGVTVNTGTLTPGQSASYTLRLTVPGGTPLDTKANTRLTATSQLSTRGTSVSGYAQDEILVRNLLDLGPVAVLPDNSGVATAGGSRVYVHRVFNNTGASDTLDLTVVSDAAAACGTPPCWSAAIYWDSNGDGVYTPGIDQQVVNSQVLATGASQLLFVEVSAPSSAVSGDRDVTHLTATSRNSPNLYGVATDTTTLTAATSHDVSGGGTRVVNPGGEGRYVGTLLNLGAAADTFRFRISGSSLYDTGGALDGLDHPTELWIDSNGDRVADTLVTTDTNGDGAWDGFASGVISGPASLGGGATYGQCSAPDAGLPCINDLAGGATLAYELRRAVPAAQKIPQEYVTLTALSSSNQADSVTATNLLAAATRATLGGLRVDVSGRVEFATLRQRGTLGFFVYQTRALSGAKVTPLTEELTSSPMPNSNRPLVYDVATAPITQPYVVIEEIEVGGKRRPMGPFEVGDATLARALEQIERELDEAGRPRGKVRGWTPREERRLARVEKERKQARREDVRRARHRPRRAHEGVAIEVGGDGIVEIPLAELEANGLPADAGRIRVFSQGERVPAGFGVNAAGATTLVFQARGLSTDYSASNVYLVTAGINPYPMTTPLTRSAPVATPGFVRIEKNNIYVASAPREGDPWLWDLLWPGWDWPNQWAWDPAGTFDIPGLAPGLSGPLRVRLQLSTLSEDEHHVTLRLNGVVVGSGVFRDTALATLEGSVPAELLHETGNTLSVSYSAYSLETGAPDDWAWAYVDAVEIEVPTLPTTTAAPVVDVESYDPSLPDFAGVQYLVVTHPLFREQADRIAQLKRDEGLNAAVVEVDEAYDRFSGGIVEPEAIAALVRYARRESRNQLKYVLLVGDDTNDPRDYSGAGQISYVPSLMAWDGELGRIPSENRFADLDGDGRPDVAIGRLPVQTVEEADALAGKIVTQTAVLADSYARHLFVTDNRSYTDAPFRAEADTVAASLPAGSFVLPFADLSSGASKARSALRSGWLSGAMMTHYFGHGGTEIWADEQVLSVANAASVVGAAPATLLFAWACESQYFLYPWGPSINEALVLLPHGGALASFGPAGISSPASQQPLIDAVYRNLFSGKWTLGEALRRAKVEALSADPKWAPYVVDGFNLLGDPALRLPRTAPPE